MGWKNIDALDLPDDLRDEWNSFIRLLCKNFISLEEEYEDSLKWSHNPKFGCYTVKLGYEYWMERRFIVPNEENTPS
jgi:hypothetical protein